MLSKLFTRIRIDTPLLREIMAEFLGTYVLVLLGDASVAQSQTSKLVNGDFFSVNWGWGIGVMLGVLIAGGVSGAHLNPAVTLALACVGRFPLIKIAFYWLAQYLGAFAAAASLLGVYNEAIQNMTQGNLELTDGNPGTAGIFATYPAPYLTTLGGFGDQVLGTFLLLLCICAITDKKNNAVPVALVPFYVGLTVIAIGISFGVNCGYALNPARDLAPRILSLAGGWGTGVFSYRNYNWFWVPIVGPHIGAILGVVVYILFIEAHWPDAEEDHIRADDVEKITNTIQKQIRSEKSTHSIDMERL